jgi:hypothetical protein
MEKVVALEGDIYFSSERFSVLSHRILDCLATGSTFSVREAKDRTSLTRRYMIPLLN